VNSRSHSLQLLLQLRIRKFRIKISYSFLNIQFVCKTCFWFFLRVNPSRFFPLKFFFEPIIAFANRKVMAKASSGKFIFPQFPNSKFFPVLRHGYFIRLVTEILSMHFLLHRICR
jgi:hypothetical protein